MRSQKKAITLFAVCYKLYAPLTRLLDVIGDLLPFYALKKVYDLPEFRQPGIRGLENFDALTSDFHDLRSEQVEDTLAEVFHRKAYDTSSTRDLLFLFRLLAVKYRVAYPVVGDKPMEIDENLRIFLEKWVCQSFIEFFFYFVREVVGDKDFTWVL